MWELFSDLLHLLSTFHRLGTCPAPLEGPGLLGACALHVPSLLTHSFSNQPGCSSFGELALLYSAPRAATVVAAADSKLWVMERAVYTAIKRTDQENVSGWGRCLGWLCSRLSLLCKAIRWLLARAVRRQQAQQQSTGPKR